MPTISYVAKNNIDKMPDEHLMVFARRFAEVVADGAYELPTPLVDAIAEGAADFGDELQEVEEKRCAYRAAVEAKDATRETLVRAIGRAAGLIYGNPAIDAIAIAEAGLQQRSTRRTPVKPSIPRSLRAIPHVNGSVTLMWDRSGNPQGVQFIVLVSSGDGEWRVAEVTTKSKVTLQGFPPGQTAQFRVYAQKSERRSLASPAAIIYPADESADLRAA